VIHWLVLLQLFSPLDPDAMAALHEERLQRLKTRHGDESAELRQASRDLGLFWLRNGKPQRAEPWLRQSLPDPDVLPYLAEAVAAQKRDAEAEALFAMCADRARCLSRLAESAERRGNLPEAIRRYRAALAAEPTGVRRNDLAQALQAAGEPKEAERLFRQALAEQDKSLGAQHPETASTLNNLASLLTTLDRYAEAEPLQRRALSIMERTLGPRHLRTGLAASNLADILGALAKPSEARRRYAQALAIFREALPPGHRWIIEAEQALAKD
jgi:tetratricopeptide (TPR) repeat protein